ncbi:myb/SANT-like DNA-binding domain-containing protein 4 [Brachionichthys hirsutus]|uniref:myb/SANT-like DNA-binding domain-containing protein 4 n=1 Tax=Brachionichthys hirsutus TaxID=412623 RepID=UPI003604586B
MDFLQVKHLKRKRKSNYSVRETQTLIKEIDKRRNVLFSRQQNTAINELKRQAWEEVAQGVNSLGEGELRTATEVKRRYLDWRALMKRKQLQTELSLCSSSSSVALKTEYDQSSSEREPASLGSDCDQLLNFSGLPNDCQCDWPGLGVLGEPSGQATMAPPDVKMEDNASEFRLDSNGEVGSGEMDEDDIPSLLSDIESHGEGHDEDAYYSNGLGILRPKSPNFTLTRDLPLSGSRMGTSVHAPGGVTDSENMGAECAAAFEKQRLEVEKQRLAVETERLAVEKELLMVEKEQLRHMEVERERLKLDRERLQVEKEKLRLLLMNQSELVDSSSCPPSQEGPSSSSLSSVSSTHDGQMERENERKGWMSVLDLETERLKLERERLQLEKERLQLFTFEAGRLQIERERLQVEKERMQLHKEHQGH